MFIKVYLIVILILINTVSFYSSVIKMPTLDYNYHGIPEKSEYNNNNGITVFASEFGPRYVINGSRIHQGLDLNITGLAINQAYSPLFAIEDGSISLVRCQSSGNNSGKSIWEISLKPNGYNRDKFTWVYMHSMSTIADYEQRKNNVRNFLLIKENKDIISGNVLISPNISHNDLINSLFNNLSPEDISFWRSYFQNPNNQSLNGIIDNLQNIRIDGKQVSGVAIIDFDDLNTIDNNVIVFFSRENDKFIPICGYGQYPNINPYDEDVNTHVKYWEINENVHKPLFDYMYNEPENITKRLVEIRSTVKAGEIIGLLGDSDSSSYPFHLHLGLTEYSQFYKAMKLLGNYSDNQIQQFFKTTPYTWDNEIKSAEKYHRGFIMPQIGFKDADSEAVRNRFIKDNPSYAVYPLSDTTTTRPLIMYKDNSYILGAYIRSFMPNDIYYGSLLTPPALNSVEYYIFKTDEVNDYQDNKRLKNKNGQPVRFTYLTTPDNETYNDNNGIMITRFKQNDYIYQYPGNNNTGVYTTTIDPYASQQPDGNIGKKYFKYNYELGSQYVPGDYRIVIVAKDIFGKICGHSTIYTKIKELTYPPHIDSISLIDDFEPDQSKKEKLKYMWTPTGYGYDFDRIGSPSIHNFKPNNSGQRKITFKILFSRDITGKPFISLYNGSVLTKNIPSRIDNVTRYYIDINPFNKREGTVTILNDPLFNLSSYSVNIIQGFYIVQSDYDLYTFVDSYDIKTESEILDQNPDSTPSINPQNPNVFIKHEKRPYIYALSTDNSSPVLQYLLLTKNGDEKIKFTANLSTGNTEITKKDLGKGNYKLNINVYDDKRLELNKMYMYLVKPSGINTILQIINEYNRDISHFTYLESSLKISRFNSLVDIMNQSIYTRWLIKDGTIRGSSERVEWGFDKNNPVIVDNKQYYKNFIKKRSNDENGITFEISTDFVDNEGKFRLIFLTIDEYGNKLFVQ